MEFANNVLILTDRNISMLLTTIVLINRKCRIDLCDSLFKFIKITVITNLKCQYLCFWRSRRPNREGFNGADVRGTVSER